MGRSLPVLAAATVTLVLWASAFVGIRALAGAFTPGALALGRLLIGAAVLGFAAMLRRPAWPTRRRLVGLAASGAVWPGAYFVLLNGAERHVDAATASLLVKLAPVLVALTAPLGLHERLSARLLGGCGIAFAGLTVVAAGGSGDRTGIVLGLGAAVAYAVGVVLQKRLVADVPPLVTGLAVTAGGALACLPFAASVARAAEDASGGDVAWLVYLGVFPTAIAFTTWAYALARTGAGRLAASTYLVPPVTLVLSVVLLGEAPSAAAGAGGVLCLAGVALACSPRARRIPGPERPARRTLETLGRRADGGS
jgi:drug/metabolite transporter (DMT)-like permease